MSTVAELIAEASLYTETDPDRARPLLLQALTARPFDASIHALLGITESDAGNLDEAAQHLESSTDLEPENPRNWYDLGVVHLRLERPGHLEHIELARDCFEIALTKRTDYVDALNNLGVCYAQTGDEIAACAAWARTIDLDPTGRRREGASAMVKDLAEAKVRHRRPRRGLWARLRNISRSSRLGVLSPMQRYLDCRDAVSESLERGAGAFKDLLAELHDESRAYWVVAQHLANIYYLLGEYEQCYRLSTGAAAALPCVRSLVTERSYFSELHEPLSVLNDMAAGRDKDAKRVYSRLMSKFASGVGLVAFTRDSAEGPTPDWRNASVVCDDGVYQVRRGGNIFVITYPGGEEQEYQMYDRSDLVLSRF